MVAGRPLSTCCTDVRHGIVLDEHTRISNIWR